MRTTTRVLLSVLAIAILAGCGNLPGSARSMNITRIDVTTSSNRTVDIAVTAFSCGPIDASAHRHGNTFTVTASGTNPRGEKCGVFIPSNVAADHRGLLSFELPDGVYEVKASDRRVAFEWRSGVIHVQSSS